MSILKLFSDLRSSLDSNNYTEANDGRAAALAKTTDVVVAAGIGQVHQKSADAGASFSAIVVDILAAKTETPVEAGKHVVIKLEIKAA